VADVETAEDEGGEVEPAPAVPDETEVTTQIAA
jgi:hypothetical protein